MKVLLVEPWMSGSHAQWANGFAEHSSHDVSIVSLPAGPWRWRLRTGSGPLACKIADHVKAVGSPDVLLLSGLVDGAQLLGLTRRVLSANVSVVVFQHESQLVYPTANGAVDGESVLRNWATWLAADQVLFNSQFHRTAMEEALPTFLASQPEGDQLPLLDSVLAKFEVVPIGLDLRELRKAGSRSTGPSPIRPTPTILWPHRWEADKDPDAFERALVKLDREGLDFRLILAGVDGLVPNQARRSIIERWGDRIDAVGPFSRTEYLRQLTRSDIVVSCAKHEFFGVAVAEALVAGCAPVLPRAVAYPELVSGFDQEVALYQPGRFGSALAAAVRRVAELSIEERRQDTAGLSDSMSRFGWEAVGPQLDSVLTDSVRVSPC